MESQIIAILECANGNDTVGEMWKEAGEFESSQPISDVIEWACKMQNGTVPDEFTGNLTIVVHKPMIFGERR